MNHFTIEISMAYHQHKPVVCIPVAGYTSDRIRNLLIDLYLDHRRIQQLLFAKTAEEAVEMLYGIIETHSLFRAQWIVEAMGQMYPSITANFRAGFL
jgi:hypothetical protein